MAWDERDEAGEAADDGMAGHEVSDHGGAGDQAGPGGHAPATLTAEDHLALARAPRLPAPVPLRGPQQPDRRAATGTGPEISEPIYPMTSPLQGQYRLNGRKPSVGQGDGAFGPVRRHEDGSPKMHSGIDITAPVGSDVMSVEPGVVTRADGRDSGGYGNQVQVRHPDGRTSLYGHLSEIHVKAGDKVDQGQTVGRTGISGNPPNGGEPHLHFGVIEGGKFVDPSPLYGRGQMHPRTSPRIYNRLYGDG